jgi:CheY-like chemotaxis protein
MGSNIDSTSLYIDQVRQHGNTLTEALSNGRNGEHGNPDLMEKCIRSTQMMAGSSLIVELNLWHQCFNVFEDLLSRYRDLSLEWDEKIAQVVSEMIEKEDLLISAHETGDIADLGCVVSAEEIQALSEEINVLLSAETAPSPHQETVPSDFETETIEPSVQPSAAAGINPSVIDTQSPLAITRVSLDREVGSLNTALSNAGWKGNGLINANIQDIHRNLSLIDFYAHAMNEILDLHEKLNEEPIMATLEPIQSALEDYADILSIGHGRRVTVEFTGSEKKIGTDLLFDVGRVLQYLMRDVSMRCDDPDLHIEVEVVEKNGALWWEMKDDGNNFIKDSKFDHDEFLAFYPSLKQVRKTLEGLNSILWVEPEDSRQARFVFTTRVNIDHNKFVVWGEGDNRYGVLSTQYCSIQSADDVSIESDSRGEHLVYNDRKVPLLRLQLLYSDAPEAGDKIVILGSLEHKVAIYVDGEGCIEEGIWMKDAVSRWKGLPRGVAELDESRIPIIEASELLVRYLSTSGDAIEDGISGGVAGDGTDLLPESQATFTEDASSPPDENTGKGVEVLVVEQSKAVIEAFESMITDAKFNMKIVERVEDALDIIRDRSPHLIISEFRMPTLAAQKIKNALLDEGKNIPIVVTTSHAGANAELLVKKLGVADYLSKPLKADMVSAKVDQYINGKGICSS